jgi:hypothetical protein
VEHDCIVGDHAHVAPAAVLCGGVSIGESVHVGAGAIVLVGVKLGAGAVVAAGAAGVPPPQALSARAARSRTVVRNLCRRRAGTVHRIVGSFLQKNKEQRTESKEPRICSWFFVLGLAQCILPSGGVGRVGACAGVGCAGLTIHTIIEQTSFVNLG